jgi:predicted transcriptional regulator of viral defense system
MKKEKKIVSPEQKAQQIIEKKGGMIRTSEAIKSGIHPRIFYSLRDSGALEQLSRGVYRLSKTKPISNPDLVTVAVRFPRAIICLASALSFHQITTQIPHAVFIALEKGAETPRIDHPPISVHRFSKESLFTGIDRHKIDGVLVQIYSPEKTLADCFKFRNKIGMDIVIEALKLYKTRKKFNLGELMKYARICRVEKVMKPYLEASL